EWITYYQRNRAWQQNQQISPPVAVQPNSTPQRHQKMRPQEIAQLQHANAPKLDPLISNAIWFSPNLPFGTLFDLSNRGAEHAFSRPGEVEASMAMAPHNSAVISAYLRRTLKSKLTPEQTEAVFGELSGYDVSAMKLVADAFRSDPVKYAEKFGALCWFEPDR